MSINSQKTRYIIEAKEDGQKHGGRLERKQVKRDPGRQNK
jgi:hypothetical protein